MKERKIFVVEAVALYEVALEFDEETENGAVLAEHAVRQRLDRSSPAVLLKGHEHLKVSGSRDATGPREAITAAEVVEAARLRPEQYQKRGNNGTQSD
ncbi:MAG: hypothetical protein KJ077_10845 [Anaerolineae bacterium]|nr:hypothetical protein [Anaerolineae bacterium]